MIHEKSRIIYYIGSAISVLALVIGLVGEIPAVIITGVILFAVSFIQALIFSRCPYCGHSFITLRGLIDPHIYIEVPKYCPDCGKEVN